MQRWFQSVWLVAAMVACRAEVIDRIAVTVGKAVITESDVIRDLRISAMLDQKPVDLSGAEKRKAADRLVDQTLILQEAAFVRVAMPSQEDQDRMLKQVKAQFPGEEAYRAALESYHVTESDLVAHLMAGLRAMRFADLRFRPEIQLTPDEVREFYDQTVVEWKQKGQAPIPTFEASRADMEKMLTDQRVSQALDRWLGTQRNETDIIYREPAFK
jgi:hypothetical protein